MKFNQKAWLKAYIYMNTELSKNDFGNDFLKLINNLIFPKTMGNVRKQRESKLVTTEARSSNNLVSEINYHTTKLFSKNSLVIFIIQLIQTITYSKK